LKAARKRRKIVQNEAAFIGMVRNKHLNEEADAAFFVLDTQLNRNADRNVSDRLGPLPGFLRT
jgi:hypothetical protein